LQRTGYLIRQQDFVFGYEDSHGVLDFLPHQRTSPEPEWRLNGSFSAGSRPVVTMAQVPTMKRHLRNALAIAVVVAGATLVVSSQNVPAVAGKWRMKNDTLTGSMSTPFGEFRWTAERLEGVNGH
jgi:hypothetical protein